jgi:hypothetical protein
LAIAAERIAVRDSALEANVLALEEQIELTAFWKKEANPPIWTKIWRDLPKYAGGAAAGLVLGLAAN